MNLVLLEEDVMCCCPDRNEGNTAKMFDAFPWYSLIYTITLAIYRSVDGYYTCIAMDFVQVVTIMIIFSDFHHVFVNSCNMFCYL